MNDVYSPIAVFGFIRPDLFKLTLDRLLLCDGVENHGVTIFIDGPRRESDIKLRNECIVVAEGFKSAHANTKIVCRKCNFGLSRNIRSGIGEVINGPTQTCIVIEDDILVSRTFLTFMDDALSFYKTDKRVFAVQGFKMPNIRMPLFYDKDVFACRRFLCWGWGTWKDRWDNVDFDHKYWPKDDAEFIERLYSAGDDLQTMGIEFRDGTLRESWAIPCSVQMIYDRTYAITPVVSLTKNTGVCSANSVHSKEYSNPHMEKMRYYNRKIKMAALDGEDDRIVRQLPYIFACHTRTLFDKYRRKLELHFLKKSWWPRNDKPIS